MFKAVFDFKNYKEFLRHALHSKDSTRGAQSSLARHLQCQPAYLYQVLKGKGHLTEDQAFKTTTFFQMKKREQEYFLLSVRFAKSASSELQKHLKVEMNNLLEQEFDLKNKSDSLAPMHDESIWSYYFSSVLPSAIHLLTSSEDFKTPEAIAKKLGTNPKLVLMHLQKLSELGFVTFKAGKWHYTSPSFHFPKDSPHNMTMQVMRRSQAVSSLFTQIENSTHYSTLFTLDKTTYDSLRLMVSEFVEKTQKTIHSGGSNELYVLSIDLFMPFGI